MLVDCRNVMTECCTEREPVDISLELIVRRHFSSDASTWSAEKMWVACCLEVRLSSGFCLTRLCASELINIGRKFFSTELVKVLNYKFWSLIQ